MFIANAMLNSWSLSYLFGGEINPNKNCLLIPNDIWLEIFSRLEISELAQAAQVCRKFNRLSSQDCIWIKIAGLQQMALEPGFQSVKQNVECYFQIQLKRAIHQILDESECPVYALISLLFKHRIKRLSILKNSFEVELTKRRLLTYGRDESSTFKKLFIPNVVKYKILQTSTVYFEKGLAPYEEESLIYNSGRFTWQSIQVCPNRIFMSGYHNFGVFTEKEGGLPYSRDMGMAEFLSLLQGAKEADP